MGLEIPFDASEFSLIRYLTGNKTVNGHQNLTAGKKKELCLGHQKIRVEGDCTVSSGPENDSNKYVFVV